MAKIWVIEAKFKNPDLWPCEQFYVEQLVQIWGLYHHFWRRYIFSKIPENAVKISIPWSSPYVLENSKLNISATKKRFFDSVKSVEFAIKSSTCFFLVNSSCLKSIWLNTHTHIFGGKSHSPLGKKQSTWPKMRYSSFCKIGWWVT